MVLCSDRELLLSCQKDHVNTPSGPAAHYRQWCETVPKCELSVVHVTKKYTTLADCASCLVYPPRRALMYISLHCDAGKKVEAKFIVEAGHHPGRRVG